MEKKNYKDDFTLLLHLYVKAESGEYVEIGFPTWDWRAKFYTTNKANAYEASYIGGEMHNCANVDDKVQVVFNNHRLLAGVLRCEFTSLIPSAEYPDGNERTVVVGDLSVTLTKEPIANDDKTISASIVVPFVVGTNIYEALSQLRTDVDTNAQNILTQQAITSQAQNDIASLQVATSEGKEQITQLQELSAQHLQEIEVLQVSDSKQATDISELQSNVEKLMCLIPQDVEVSEVGTITLGVGDHKISAKLLPEGVAQNILLIGDNVVLRVDQQGNIYPLQEGKGTILVVPTLNTAITKQISVDVQQGSTILVSNDEGSFHLTSDGLIRIQ